MKGNRRLPSRNILSMALILIFLFSSQLFAADESVQVNEVYKNRIQRGRLISWKFLRSMGTRQIYNDVINMPFLSSYKTFDFKKLDQFTDKKKIKAAIKHPISVYQIIYETVDPYGNVTPASGAVLVPQGVNRPVPLWALNRGTIYYDLDSPSYGEMSTWGIWRALMPASSGYVVAMADYLGFGASKHLRHPYIISKPTATAVVDMMRATRAFTQELGASLNGQVFLQGMSEGGSATLATQREIEAYHADEFNLVASAPGAPPSVISSMMKFVLGSDRIIAPQIFSLIVMSYNEVYQMNRPLTDFFKEPYAGILEELHNLDHDNDYITNHLPKKKTTDLYQEGFLEAFRGTGEQQLKEAFVANDLLLGWIPKTKMRIYNGTADKIIPYKLTQLTAKKLKKAGGDVELVSIEGAPHIDSMIPITLLSIAWFDELRTDQ